MDKKEEFIFNQCIANLGLENLFLNDQGKKIARNYYEGKLKHTDLLKEAREYALNE